MKNFKWKTFASRILMQDKQFVVHRRTGSPKIVPLTPKNEFISKRKTLLGFYQRCYFFVLWIIYFIKKTGVSYRHPICDIFVVVSDLLRVISEWQIFRPDQHNLAGNGTDLCTCRKKWKLQKPEPIWRYFELSTAEGVGTRRAQILYTAQAGGVAVVVTLSLRWY